MGWGLEYCKFARWMAHSAVRRANYGERRRWWLFESTWRYHYSGYPARMAELADATDSKSVVRKGVWVQVPLRALWSLRRERLRRPFSRLRAAQRFSAAIVPSLRSGHSADFGPFGGNGFAVHFPAFGLHSDLPLRARSVAALLDSRRRLVPTGAAAAPLGVSFCEL